MDDDTLDYEIGMDGSGGGGGSATSLDLLSFGGLDEDDDDNAFTDDGVAGVDYVIGALDEEDDEFDADGELEALLAEVSGMSEDEDAFDEYEDDDALSFGEGEVGRRRRMRARQQRQRARQQRRARARKSLNNRIRQIRSLSRVRTRKRNHALRQLHQNQQRLARAYDAVRRRVHSQRLDAASKAGEVPQIFLGVDSAQKSPNGIPPGQSLTIPVESTEPLRITNFVVADSIAQDFVISRIQIGRLNLLAGSHPVPAEAFRANYDGPPIATPKLPAGTEAKVEVTNISTASRRFIALFAGIDLTRNKH